MCKHLFHYSLIRRSGLFNAAYYLICNPDVRKADIDPLMHFIKLGWKELRNPSAEFNTEIYLQENKDVKAANINPLIHYIKFGKKEGRSPGIQTLLEPSPETDLDLALSNGKPIKDYEYRRFSTFNIVEFFFNPFDESKTTHIQTPRNIAIHIHFFNFDNAKNLLEKLNNFPLSYDLFVTTSTKIENDYICDLIKSLNLIHKKLKITEAIGYKDDLTPMIACFGKNLLDYDYILHIHNQRSSENNHRGNVIGDNLNILLGSESYITQILKLLDDDANFVYPAPEGNEFINNDGWSDYYDLSKVLLNKYYSENIDHYQVVEFPQNSLFWAKTTALREFLQIPVNESGLKDCPNHSIDESTATLKRLLLISSANMDGKNYRLYTSGTVKRTEYYECQIDYSKSIETQPVKVLSYYLPQFYAIPENDRWHGKGFTEWNKVRSANPLFYGHNQQRAPHDDLGYYYLDSIETLLKQADLMKSSGVYGQIFYHYWFQGKLILEKPAQLLLENKSIDMPFCFCWANENWTRKWDGNENDVLLSQEYSEQDANAFINYLIPFLKDPRYIKIDGRPVLFIYRPALFPDFTIYKKSWKNICEQNDIEEPFLVAVLTRGAISPNNYGMSGGCERVLHDWTDGNVKPINQSLYMYQPINRDILDYKDVSQYYINQDATKDFTYFRSLIPSWDNTPRYGSDAYIVHNSTPQVFQEWLRHLIVDAEKRLPKGKQFVIINAWNEWSESAYLEPDKKNGYAYLNSIGRALSDVEFNDREYLHKSITNDVSISIQFSDHLKNELLDNEYTRSKMINCIRNSTVFSLCKVSFSQDEIKQWIKESDKKLTITDYNESDYKLIISKSCFFPPNMIENLLKMSLMYDVGTVIPTHVNDETFTHENLSIRWEASDTSEYVILQKDGHSDSIKCCVDAEIFITKPEASKENQPKVSTIIRFSGKDNLVFLHRALFSLFAQIDCKDQPIIALNNLSQHKYDALVKMLDNVPWDKDCYPILRKYNSETGQDLRSLMLNDSLKQVKTKFVAFLDFDDVMFHDAYRWLLMRMEKTNKKASFGLVYNLIFNQKNNIMRRRVINHYGKNYMEFLDNNCTPLHGFMLDTEKINLDKIKYYDDMKYMEDYFLTLQIFDDENTDWESLQQNKYIADYIHFEDKQQTLGLLDDKTRKSLLFTQNYQKCQENIDELRRKIFSELK